MRGNCRASDEAMMWVHALRSEHEAWSGVWGCKQELQSSLFLWVSKTIVLRLKNMILMQMHDM